MDEAIELLSRPLDLELVAVDQVAFLVPLSRFIDPQRNTRHCLTCFTLFRNTPGRKMKPVELLSPKHAIRHVSKQHGTIPEHIPLLHVSYNDPCINGISSKVKFLVDNIIFHLIDHKFIPFSFYCRGFRNNTSA
jgi:hypothetical protein